MSEDNKDDINNDEGNKDEGDKLTLESLAEMVTSTKAEQAAMVETLKSQSEQQIAQLKQVVASRDNDIQNLTNLLGQMANPNEEGNDEIDLTDPKNIKDLVDKTVDERTQAQKDREKKEHSKYLDAYSTDIAELMDKNAPDGKPFSQEARDAITKLLVDVFIDKTDNPTRDAYRNFEKAKASYYGLDKTNPFKGGDTKGIGGGGGEFKSGTKKTYTLTAEDKAMVNELGETEEWAQEVMAKRAKEGAAA